MKKQLWPALCFAAVAAVYLSLYTYLRSSTTFEPDRYFHLAVARLIAAHGWIHSFPQADNLPWKHSFPQNYFLFALLTSLLYKIGGEAGALLAVPMLSCGLLFVLFRIARRITGPEIAALILVALIFDPYMLVRMIMLRPHILAFLTFFIMVDGLLERRPVVALVGGALYSLSYHLVYVPLGFVILHSLVGAREGKGWWKVHVAAALGLFGGSIINPAFPQNWLGCWQTLSLLLLGSSNAPLQRPLELMPEPLDQWGKRHLVELVAIGFGLLFAWNPFPRLMKSTEPSPTKADLDFTAILLATIPFWCGTIFVPRLAEYAMPLTAVAAAMLLARIDRRVAAAATSVGIAILVYFYYGATTEGRFLPGVLDPKYENEAIATIPASASGKKVFNCSWSSSAHIFYERPDLKFIDISDPGLLYQYDRVHFFMRQQFLEGKVSYPYGMIKSGFHADYVLCPNQGAMSQLDRDPHFIRLYPKKLDAQNTNQNNMYFLYEVVDKPVTNFVYKYQTAQVTKDGNPWHIDRDGVGEWQDFDSKNFPFVELKPTDRKVREQKRSIASSSKSNIMCTAVRPTPEEVKGHSGATLLGVGGGTSVRIWWNGKKLFSTNGGFSEPRLIDLFVPLPRPLSANDDLVALVCAGKFSAFHALTLSFWDKPQIDAFCDPKGSKALFPPEKEHSWEYWNVQQQNCIAPLAIKEISDISTDPKGKQHDT